VLVIFIQIQGFVKILQVRPFGVVLAIRCSVVTNAAAIASRHTKDTLARGYLISTIESQQQRSLINCNTAHEMWVRLSAQYLRNAVENRYVLQTRFFEYHFKPDKDIMAHISEIETMVTQLTVPTKLLGTPPYFQCILMALRVLEKCNNS
jgi:uncharacterized oligopeptide transporter (OPT) family protein